MAVFGRPIQVWITLSPDLSTGWDVDKSRYGLEWMPRTAELSPVLASAPQLQRRGGRR